MKILKKLAFITLTALGTLTLQGCLATTLVSTAAVATKVATDPRSTGTQVDDEILEEKVSYNINKDEQIKEEARVNVVVYGGKALLVGQAPNETASESAKNIAAGVEGIREVYNEIRIGEPISASQIALDSWITTTVKSKLLLNSQVKTTEVKVLTENGEVFLMGKLDNNQANAAAEVARNVNNVKKVVKVITYVQ